MVDTYTTAVRPGTPAYSALLQSAVQKMVLEATREGLPFLPQGGTLFTTYRAKQGDSDTYLIPGLGDLDESLTPTPDEISSPAIEQLQEFNQSFSTTEYHRAVGFSSTAERMLPFSMGSTIAERIARAAAVAFDTVAKNIWEAGASGLPHIGVSTATLTRGALVDLATTMRALNVPPLSDGSYGLIVPPAAVGDLLKESGDASVSQLLRETDESVVRTGVVGTINGIRLIISTRLTKGALDAYKCPAFGANAIAFADTSSIQTSLVMPTPSISDPTARRGVAAYVLRAGGKLLSHRQVHSDATGFFNAAIVELKATAPTVATQALFVAPEGFSIGGDDDNEPEAKTSKKG